MLSCTITDWNETRYMIISYYENKWRYANNHLKGQYDVDFDDICSIATEYCGLSTIEMERLSKFLNDFSLYVKNK